MSALRIMRARHLAEVAHWGQLRKHTGEPYFEHCRRVAHVANENGVSTDGICAAWLHDTIEDTAMKYVDIETACGWTVRDMVWELTTQPVPLENRARRKERERNRLASTGWPYDIHTIKVADMLDNVDDIVRYEPDFAPVFLEEKRLLLRVLTKANPLLLAEAWRVLDRYTKGELQKHDGDARLRDVPR